MILDNENKNKKVHEWIGEYTEEGTFDIVTGYFTIGALSWLSRKVNQKISNFRMVLGDIVNFDAESNRPLDLLNEDISIEAALKLNKLSKEAVRFLKQDKVLAKTLEPNFCHAKSYLFNPEEDERNKYFITGSSNLTEAGVGLKFAHNIELNIGETGNNNQYKELCQWFESLWKSPKTHKDKTLIAADGKQTKIDFKQYLINEIERIFIEYTPKDLYFKVLFELFGSQMLEIENDPEFNRQIGRLENSVIYNTLYDFQKKGVLSLIRMLQKYNGAILADAVGLGKTWSALAVMKFFQLQGREVILLCPKKLEHNWNRYRRNQDSRFEKDQLDYFIRFHTDMCEDRVETYTDRGDKYFINDKPKLIVIDESHNLRNDKSNRYKFLVEEILARNEDVKVLLLSATPINNSLTDIRNQFKMMVQGKVHGFDESLGIRNIDYSFRTAQQAFNEWRQEPQPVISEFIKKLPSNFFTLTDSLIVARTRAMIEGPDSKFTFPLRAKPVNLFVTPAKLGNIETFEELFENFPPMLSGYQPSFYLKEEKDEGEKKNILTDERQRDRFLVKMMYILLVKRLESSWYSFFSTVGKIKDHHQNALEKIIRYQEGVNKDGLNDMYDDDLFGEDDMEADYQDLTLGKKRKVNLSDIDEGGNLDYFKEDLKEDIKYLENLHANLERFQTKISKETKHRKNLHSDDTKLETLIKEINKKQTSGRNSSNQKIVVFTVYRDTAEYLFEQLKQRGFNKLAMVSGSGSLISDTNEETKKFEPILERFAPYTKLYMEKEWDFKTEQKGLDGFYEWGEWIKQNDPKTYNKIENPIDILIATDALSEGQNLQDADMVINYDIHWNPVRIIQRMGRIDRLGSPNEKVYSINFWPSDNINTYLNLQGRIEQRMAAMKLAGSEVDHQFSDTFNEMASDESLDQKMKNRMMQQMQITLDDIESNEQSLGFNDLSLEQYRQDLLAEFLKDKDKYMRMPKGLYTGFKADKMICPEDGIIALLGSPSKPPKALDHEYKVFDLIYINKHGDELLLNQKEVLEALTHHKESERFVPYLVDGGEKEAIDELVQSLKSWLDKQTYNEEKQEDGTTKKTMGIEAKDILSKLRKGDKKAISRVKENVKVNEKFQLDNFDLITWFIVTPE